MTFPKTAPRVCDVLFFSIMLTYLWDNALTRLRRFRESQVCYRLRGLCSQESQAGSTDNVLDGDPFAPSFTSAIRVSTSSANANHLYVD